MFLKQEKLAAIIAITGACVGSVAYQIKTSAVERTVASVTRDSKPSAPNHAEQKVPSDQETFLEFQKRLNEAEAAVTKISGYTAILEKQEEVNGELNDADQIDVKIRHKPFSVYMRWHDDGQEVLYVEGENDNRLLAKPTKGFAAMSKKTWRLDPESKQATRNCRYPITTLGIENLLERVKEFYHSHVDAKDGIKCRVSETDLTGTIVRVYEVRFANPDVSPDYCHSRYYFEKKTGLLVGLENYCWDKEAESPLVEKYIYRKVNTQVHLNDSDFDESNPKYAFSD
ncbi:MAG: DUF1571 domain-containing protein [Planctomycetales bacterium]